MTTSPSPVRNYRKDPDAVLDYGLDWTDWLASGEAITASAWEAVPGTISLANPTFSDEATKVWVSGGTDGEAYFLTNRITTSDNRTDDRTIGIVVAER